MAYICVTIIMFGQSSLKLTCFPVIINSSVSFHFQVEPMQKAMGELIMRVIEEITVETVDDWGSCLTDISVSCC